MNTEQARALVAETFPKPFDKGRFRNFVINLLNHIDESKAKVWNTTYVKDAFKGHVKGYERLGTYTSPDDEKLDVLIVHLTAEYKLERARTAIRNFVADHLKTRDNKDAALVAFVSPTEKQWRFSYVKMEYATVEKVDGKVGVQIKLTPARRSSYIVGEGESCHTAQTRFLALLQDTEKQPTLAQIEDAFSVEAVTKEFFEQYMALFLDLKDELDDLAKKEKTIGAEFANKKVSTADFAKKLMGQIVFLYFLQKKGWMGVPKGGDWGEGPHNFLSQLFDGKFRSYKNFFNDTLEPLFYDTLATDRGHGALCKTFNCRIPFLNGGLFEPLCDYDWRKTDIVIPNSLFSNTKAAKAGETGTGIFDVFNRYNFTVNEAEPLEKDVAIDPEMLGKVFENLLEVKERKSKGSYYTPREIVHYMCQESLINYLDTALNATEETVAPSKTKQSKLFGEPEPEQSLLKTIVRHEIVPRKEIETFVHLGEQISHYEAVEARYVIKMPKSIEQHARRIDEKLADIAVCDPAIGSGAFPVGMMQEIVRARSSLTPYFNDVRERSAYHFKRHAIQNSLYGVDIDPGAVEIAKLRLWLSLVVDEVDVQQIKPLPNLDYKIVVGNSLIGFPFKSKRIHDIEELKRIHFDETDHAKKVALKEKIDSLIHECFANSKRSLGYEVAFDFEIYFSEVFQAKGGFDVVIANPPYIDSEQMTKTAKELRDAVQANYKFTKGNWDIYIAFFELAFNRLNRSGVLSFITPDKWIAKPFGNEMRRLTTAKLDSILRAGREIFEHAKVDAIVTVYCCAESQSIKVRDFDGRVISDKRIVAKSELVAPFTYDWLFSDSLSLLSKIEDTGVRLATIGTCENACATSDAYKLQDLVKNAADEPDLNKYFKIINTGTIGKYVSRWGFREMVYLGDRYLRPVVDRAAFLREFPNSYGKKSVKPKLIAKGLNLLDVCLDERGDYIPGKTTLIVTAGNLRSLKLLLALLNHPLALFYFKQRYPAASYNQGTSFTKDMLNEFPVPKMSGSEVEDIVSLVDRVLSDRIKQQPSSQAEESLRTRIYELYGLTHEEIALIEAAR